jgi:flagellar motor switch protein FliN
MEKELKQYDINNLYKVLRKHDVEILKHYNCDEISDNDYFFYGINSDIISNALNILTNYLSGNIESAGVDLSARTILEAMVILKMDGAGDISENQKKMYRYLYAYVDADNFHSVMKDMPEGFENENIIRLNEDKEKATKAMLEHFGCTERDLKDRKISIDDPCFYLKKNLRDDIRFSKLLEKYPLGDGSEIDDFLKETFVKITFKLQIGDLVDSFLMQLYPIPLVKEMCSSVISNMEDDSDSTVNDEAFAEEPAPAPAPEPAAAPQPAPQPAPQAAPPPMGAAPMPDMQMQQMAMPQQQVNVQPAQFQPFAGTYPTALQPENIDLIMDVPLEVTVELGRTHKSIQEILDFAPGTILELNKIAGEPIDVLVNGKYVAKGEVVVIEESFGIRITEIMK